jgi:DNA-binding SARP family transcriptional activator
LSIQAELVLRRVADLDGRAFEVVRHEAGLRPERWRWALRRALSDGASGHVELRRCAELLELVGEAEDVRTLRSLAHRKPLRIPDAGRALVRRLAPPVHVDDLGRVNIRVGDRTVPGTDIRRKVLALLTYLITRPQFTASREQVVEALWPEMAPEQGANSLNQTAYFLRRVFEPGADDDTSAGYLNSRGDLIWIDPDLVTTQSALCLDLIAQARRNPTPDVMAKLVESYPGRFAIDFTYDDWAANFRESLHASFLDRVERALDLDIQAGAFHRAVPIAQLALQADPEADQIELKLLHLYRVTGAQAAAAELYAHYSTTMREQLGVEPPPLESI